MISDRQPDGAAPRHFGLYPAIVTALVDDRSLGRVEVRFPWLGEDGDREVRAWATVLSPYADASQGLMMLPEVGSQVIVGFEAGDLRRPYVVGACWNGREALPDTPTEQNDKRLIRSRANSRLEFDDTEGAAKVTISTDSGHRVVVDEGGSNIEIRHANGCYVKVDASGQVSVKANSTVEVYAPALNVHSQTATFDGAVNCTTLTAKVAVVSPTFSQGAGNMW